MKINLKVRFKNPVFIAQLAMSIILPILAYMGLTVEDLTTWEALGNVFLEALGNPYVLGVVAVSVFNCITDPTTQGVSDSAKAMNYNVPEKNCNHK